MDRTKDDVAPSPSTGDEDGAVGDLPSGRYPNRVSRARGATIHERAALCAMVEAKYRSAIYCYCARVLGDRTLAADVLQQVLEVAVRDVHALKHPELTRSWLFGIATHRCLDAIRARRREEKRFVECDENLAFVPDDKPGPADRVDAALLARIVDECVRQLSAESRMAVLLRFQEGLTFEEMGRMCRE